jgi:hypothetical protein
VCTDLGFIILKTACNILEGKEANEWQKYTENGYMPETEKGLSTTCCSLQYNMRNCKKYYEERKLIRDVAS